jgi:hypothetical protein
MSVGAAIASHSVPQLGVSGMDTLTMTYVAGAVFVGNGTLGATNSVYYMNNAGSEIFTTPVPIFPGDANIGQGYCTDVMKHFCRRAYENLLAIVVPQNPATNNSMVCNMAAIRGGGTTAVAASTGTTAGLTQANLLGAQGNVTFASWERGVLNCTKFIAGGSGSRQNEFAMEASANSEGNPTQASQVLSSPLMLAISGNNSTTALQDTATHLIIVQFRVKLLDFLGGLNPTTIETPKPLRGEADQTGNRRWYPWVLGSETRARLGLKSMPCVVSPTVCNRDDEAVEYVRVVTRSALSGNNNSNSNAK